MNRRTWIVPLLATTCLGLAGGIFACGTDDTGSPEQTVEATATPAPLAPPPELSAYLVNRRDIGRQPQGSPERAFLLWWQAMQYDNMVDAYRGLTRRLRLTRDRAKFVRAARDAGGGFSAKPQVTQKRETAEGRVTLLVSILVIGKGGAVESFLPRSFQMQMEDGEWKVGDLSYLDVKAAEGRAAIRAARRAAAAADK